MSVVAMMNRMLVVAITVIRVVPRSPRGGIGRTCL